jgi:hypothetical protein
LDSASSIETQHTYGLAEQITDNSSFALDSSGDSSIIKLNYNDVLTAKCHIFFHPPLLVADQQLPRHKTTPL